MEAVLLLLKYGANVNAFADERHDYRTVMLINKIQNNKQIYYLENF